MKKLVGTLCLCAGISPAFAQNNFTLTGPPSPPVVTIDEIPAVTQGASAMGDIDNDGDQDLIISGFNRSYQVITKLYTNNGIGGYTLTPSSFDQVRDGSIELADIDGDNDLDVLITGISYERVAKLYVNNGSGVFTVATGTPFVGVFESFTAIADVNGDSFPDILICGNSAPNVKSSSLYLNNGAGAFTLAAGTPFAGSSFGKAAFGDVNGDADQDLVITGADVNNNPSTQLYTNDGDGAFTPVTSNLGNTSRGTINLGDLDGDNDLDVFMTGHDGSSVISQLYKNDGTGYFTLMSGTPFTAVYQGSVAFGDTDGDGDTDILLSGSGNTSVLAELHRNNGNGIFTKVDATLFQGIAMGSVFLTDIDGDNDRDAFLIGSSGSYGTATFYTNNAGVFTPLIKSPFTGVSMGASAFADIDGDGDADALITGKDMGDNTVARLYTNGGNGNYTLVPGTPFEGIIKGGIGFSDIDGDGDQDVLITGYSTDHSTANLYTNDGEGVFTHVVGTPFTPMQEGSLAFADIDGDGDEDVLLTGYNGSYQSRAELYVNTAGTFALVAGTPFIGVSYSKARFADLDGDSDQDLIIIGMTGSYTPITQRFSNDGTGVFTAVDNAPFTNLGQGSLSFGDIDGDNDIDVLLTGDDNTYTKVSKLYANDGSGTFTALTSDIVPFNQSTAAFTDAEGDGDLDLLIAGYANGPQSILYNNNGAGVFTEVSNTPFKGVRSGSLSIADMDGNGKPDILITGEDDNSAATAFLYRNMNCTPTTGTDTQEACSAYTWIDGIEYTASTSTPTWALTNSVGCDSIVTLHLTIQDLLAPVADIAELANVTASCVITELEAPTATDNCAGTIEGTTTQVFPIITEGTTVVTWTFDDGNGHTITQTQDVVLAYNVAPVPVNAMLADITATCTVIEMTAPTATENCTDAEITATTEQEFPITTQGTTVVTWMYEDANGNISTQTQNVIIADVTAPVADNATLEDITATCSYDMGTAQPSATDACAGIIAGVASHEVISTLGTTVVTWTFDDGNGNVSTQNQNVIITDTEAPVADATTLPDVTATCSIPLEITSGATATDACAGEITGTTEQEFPITTIGTTVVTWTFDDGHGNVSTQTQNFIVNAVNAETTVSANNTITATNANGTYQWVGCDATVIAGANSQSFTPTANGNYAVIVTENGCSATSACVSITTVGINELAGNSALHIYPNPNAGSFTIETARATTVEIRNAAGQLIRTQALEAGQTAIELTNIESGIYFVSATDGNPTVYRVSVVH